MEERTREYCRATEIFEMDGKIVCGSCYLVINILYFHIKGDLGRSSANILS